MEPPTSIVVKLPEEGFVAVTWRATFAAVKYPWTPATIVALSPSVNVAMGAMVTESLQSKKEEPTA